MAQISPDGSEPVMAASERVYLPMSDNSSKDIVPGLAQALKDAAARSLAKFTALDARLFAPPTGLYIFLHAPWATSRNVPLYRDLGKDTFITDALISAMAKESLSSGRAVSTGTLMEATVASILINGYATHAPNGKRGREIRIDTLIGESDPGFRTTISAAIESTFPALKPQWRTHTRAVIRALDDRLHGPANCVVLDIGGEATTILVIRKGRIEAQEIIEGGTRALLSAVASGSLPEEVLSIMKMIERDECSTDACQRVASALAAQETSLIRSFGEKFTMMAAKRRLPHQMYLLTRSELTGWFTRFFARLDFSQFTVTSLPFSVDQINANRDEGDEGNTAQGVVMDTALYLGAQLVNSESKD